MAAIKKDLVVNGAAIFGGLLGSYVAYERNQKGAKLSFIEGWMVGAGFGLAGFLVAKELTKSKKQVQLPW